MNGNCTQHQKDIENNSPNSHKMPTYLILNNTKLDTKQVSILPPPYKIWFYVYTSKQNPPIAR